MNKRRDALREMMAPINATPGFDERQPKAPVKSGSLKAMGLSLQSLSDEADEARHLRDQMSTGEHIVEIAAERIDPSFVRDRLDDPSPKDFAELKASIAESGQQIPVLLRPSPTDPSRFQVAYGHRRVEALRQIGRPVKAIVRQLSDDELIVAQGKENLERRDLSFIERALFAARLENHGIGRAALIAALSVHKGNLSTMIAVARAIPEPLIIAIGPAPKVGRPRWEELAQLVPKGEAKWRALVGQTDFLKLESDARFAAVLKALTPAASQKPKGRSEFVKDQSGRQIAFVEEANGRCRLTIEARVAPDFSTYLIDQLPEIYAAFLTRRGDA